MENKKFKVYDSSYRQVKYQADTPGEIYDWLLKQSSLRYTDWFVISNKMKTAVTEFMDVCGTEITL